MTNIRLSDNNQQSFIVTMRVLILFFLNIVVWKLIIRFETCNTKDGVSGHLGQIEASSF